MLIRCTCFNGVVVYQSPRLLEMGVKHAFSTRIGGVSRPPFDSLNLGNPMESDCQDSAANIGENYRRLLAGVGLSVAVRAWVRQVHGCGVAVLEEASRGRPGLTRTDEVPPDFQGTLAADAIICSRENVVATMRIADCVPILLAAGRGRVVAAVHAGWRGVAGNVVASTMDKLEQMGIAPGEVIAAIGPAIGRDFFMVNSDVTTALLQADLAEAIVHDSGRQDRVDLNLAVRRQLARRGVAQMDFGDYCTYRDKEEFFSHRRESGRTGRMAAVIAPTCIHG
jgi:YfiH family protein